MNSVHLYRPHAPLTPEGPRRPRTQPRSLPAKYAVGETRFHVWGISPRDPLHHVEAKKSTMTSMILLDERTGSPGNSRRSPVEPVRDLDQKRVVGVNVEQISEILPPGLAPFFPCERLAPVGPHEEQGRTGPILPA